MCMIPFWKNWKRNIYAEMILIPFAEVIEDDNFIYQNDNAPRQRIETKIYKI